MNDIKSITRIPKELQDNFESVTNLITQTQQIILDVYNPSLQAFNNSLIKTINTSFSPVSVDLTESINATFRTVNANKELLQTIQTSLKVVQPTNVMSSITTELQDLLSRTLNNINFSEVVDSLKETVNVFSDNFDTDQFQELYNFDYSAIFADIVPKSSNVVDVLDYCYSVIQGKEIDTNDLNHDLTEKDIKETIKQQTSNPIGFQERVANSVEKYKIKYFILICLINWLMQIFVQPYLAENIGMPVMTYIESHIKELPEKGAAFIYDLKEGVKDRINEKGEEVEGYVAKRNLKIIKDDDLDEKQTDEISENEIEK